MDKEVGVHIHKGNLCTYKKKLKKINTFESFLMRWMNLEPIIQNEASQKEKDKYFVLMHLYEIQKDSANNQGNKGDTDVKNSILDSVGEGKCGKI